VLSSRFSPPAPLPWKKFERRERDAREEGGGRNKSAKAEARCNEHKAKELASHINDLSGEGNS